MDDTESYLNSILKKRLGSVVNYNSSHKTVNTVTRIPKQEEKIESMPTVFRKKHETVYIQGANNNNSQYSQMQSEYMSMKQGSRGPQSQMSGNEVPEESNRQSSNQRVEYMLISKRIQSKKQDEFISPTVDVTSYTKVKNVQGITDNLHRNTQQQQPEQHSYQSNFYTGMNKMNKEIGHVRSEQYLTQKPRHSQEQSEYDHAMGSKLSVNTDKSKRKKIF